MSDVDIPGYQEQEVVQIAVEICGLCSSFYDKPQRNYAQPYVNRLICKVLEVVPPTLSGGGTSHYFNQYLPICPDCTTRVKTYDKKRIELAVLKQEIVSAVLDTLEHIRPNDKSLLHSLKNSILEKWTKESFPVEVVNGNAEKNQQKEISTTSQNRIPIPTKDAEKNQQKEISAPSQKRIPTVVPCVTPPKKLCATEAKEGHVKRLSEFIQKRIILHANTNSNSNLTVTEVKNKSESNVERTVSDIENLTTNPTQQQTPTTSATANAHHDPNSPVWQVGNEVNVTTDSGTQELAVATTNYIAQHIQEDIEEDYINNEQSQADCVIILPEPDEQEQEESVGADGSENYSEIEHHDHLDEPQPDECAQNYESKKSKPKKTPKRQKKEPPFKVPQHEKGPFFCESCGSVFSKQFGLKRHVQTQSCLIENDVLKLKQCPICPGDDVFFESWIDLKFHIDFAHENIVLEKCRLCKMEFLPNTLAWHKCPGLEMKLKPQQSWPCDFCDKLYFNSESLSKHMYRNHVKSPADKPFKCNICNRKFVSMSILEAHKDSHKASDTIFKCHICGIGSKTKRSLKEHCKLHTAGEKPFACEICGKRFLFRRMLLVHSTVHTNERNYQCELCDKKFKSSGTLQRHWKRHLDPLPGVREICPLCNSGVTYRKTKNLKKHMMSCHAGTAEQLEICARPDDPEEDLMFSQSKIPTPKTERNTGEGKNSKKRKQNEVLSSDESEIEESDDEKILGDLDAEGFDPTNNGEEVSSANSRTLTMNTRNGGKRNTIGF